MKPVRNPKNKSLSNAKAIKHGRRVSNPVRKKFSNGAGGTKYDIITFGSATLDIFLKTEDFLISPVKEFITQKGVCFPFGSKVDVKELFFHTGGGGTNTAATFASQGFKVAFCGRIGQDFAGKEVLKDLKKCGINTQFVSTTQKALTNLSIIFSWGKPRTSLPRFAERGRGTSLVQGKDRTCFAWKGASELLQKKEVPWQKLKARWLYLAPLSGKLAHVFEPLVDFAKRNNIKVFANLGNSQINLGIRKLRPCLAKIDILLLNQEEASLLTKISFQKEKKVFKKLDTLVPGIVIMTKGTRGAVVSDGNYIWQAKAPTVSVVEKTGAGDAFGSGFLTGFIRKKDVVWALQLGMANAIACIQEAGAKRGLLRKGQSWKKARVIKKKLN